MPEPHLRRSMLMTPGNRPERLAKAVSLGADALIFDLEDAVPPPLKADARRHVREALETLEFGRTERVVRINAIGTPDAESDLGALPLDRIDAIMVPKVERPEALAALDRALTERSGQSPGARRVELIVTLETPRGILGALPIAEATTRTTALFFGSGDYTAETGGAVTPTALHVPRTLVVMAAAAQRIQAIDAAYFLAVKDAARTRADALDARELGFDGKVVFHPSQIAVANEVFTPDPAAIDRAKRIIAAHRESVARGHGTAMMDGSFIAVDILLMAERTLSIARQAGCLDPEEGENGTA